MFFDTHCHLDMMVAKERDELLVPERIAELDALVKSVHEAGVCGMINVGTNMLGSQRAIFLARRYSQVYATLGIHPCDCGNHWQEELRSFIPLLEEKKAHKIVALGETGLDFFHQPYDKDRQVAAFKEQIELALRYNLPVIIHAREASDEVLNVVQEYVPNGLRGVLHCFSHPAYVAEQFLAWGFYIGMGAYITYPKNNDLRVLVQHDIPLEKLLLETDAPFLPPQQYRGKQNSPAYVPLFAQTIADLKKVHHDELGRVTTANAQALFSLI